MPHFRKRPVVIEAEQVPLSQDTPTLAAWGRLAMWLGAGGPWEINDSGGVDITTLEGVMTASPGDWVIRGVAGELYPIKADILAATYEPVDDDTERDTSQHRG